MIWKLTLKDAMSGAAGRAKVSMDRLDTSLHGVDRSSRRVDASMRRVSKSTRGLGGAAAQPKSGLGGLAVVMGGIGAAAFGAASQVAGLGAELARLGVGAAFEGIKHVRGLQAFRESSLFAFKQIAGTKKEAEAIYALAAKTSFDVGADLQITMATMNTLLARGFKAPHADKLIRQMADLSVINPKANIEQLVNAIAQIKGKGTLQLEELQQQLGESLPVEKVIAQLSRSRGKTDAEIRKLISAGSISGDEGIAAIEAAISEMTGGKAPGAVASEKASKSIEGLAMRALNMKDQMLAAVNIDWSPVARGLEKLMGAMSSKQGQKFFEQIGSAISSLMGRLDKMSKTDLETMFEKGGETLASLAALLGSVADLAVSLGPMFGQGADSANTEIDGLTMKIKTITATIELVKLAWNGVTSAFSAAWDAITGLFDGMSTSITESANSLGSNIIGGITSGIASGASAVVDAITSTVDAAISAAEELLGIASPSKVFDKMFYQVTRGAVRGTDRGSDAVSVATRDMSESSVKSAQTANDNGQNALRTGRAAGQVVANTTTNSSSNRTLNVGDIHVQGKQDDPQATAHAVRSQIRTLQLQAG